jgi:hypothetical protein
LGSVWQRSSLRTPRWSAAVGVGDDECPRSVVEDVPADRASTLLVIKDQLSNLRGIPSRSQSRSRTRADFASLAKAEAKTALIAYAAAPRSWAATWATATACPAARAANFAGSGSPCAAAFATNAAWCASRMRTSPRIHERPMSIASRGRVSRGCSCSKRVQDVFGAEGGPLRKLPVVLLCQCSAAAHGDQPGVTLGWQDRHEFILSRHPAVATSSP